MHAERDQRAEELEEEEMDTSGHGDKLEGAVRKVTGEEELRKRPDDKLERVPPEDMQTSGHGDKLEEAVERAADAPG